MPKELRPFCPKNQLAPNFSTEWKQAIPTYLKDNENLHITSAGPFRRFNIPTSAWSGCDGNGVAAGYFGRPDEYQTTVRAHERGAGDRRRAERRTSGSDSDDQW